MSKPIKSRYVPGEALDYAALERAYEVVVAEGSISGPQIGIATLHSMAVLRASKTGESVEDAYQWLIDNSEVGEVDGLGTVRVLSDGIATLLLT